MPVLIHYSLLVLLVALCTYLFLSLKQELRVAETRSVRRVENLRAQLRELKEEMVSVQTAMEVMEGKSDPSATVARTLGPIARIQALRMIKQGEGLQQIATALNLPRPEVELLIKVQRQISDPELQPTV